MTHRDLPAVLPAKPTEMTETPRAQRPPAPLGAPKAPGLDLLLLEDDSLVGDTLRVIFEQWGFRVRWTQGSAAALAAVAERVPDLVVSDYHLGEGRTSREFLAALAAAHPSVPRIGFSGDARALAELVAARLLDHAVEKGHSLKLRDLLLDTARALSARR
jgi:DNA-binding NtrC family response regulator